MGASLAAGDIIHYLIAARPIQSIVPPAQLPKVGIIINQHVQSARWDSDWIRAVSAPHACLGAQSAAVRVRALALSAPSPYQDSTRIAAEGRRRAQRTARRVTMLPEFAPVVPPTRRDPSATKRVEQVSLCARSNVATWQFPLMHLACPLRIKAPPLVTMFSSTAPDLLLPQNA